MKGNCQLCAPYLMHHTQCTLPSSTHTKSNIVLDESIITFLSPQSSSPSRSCKPVAHNTQFTNKKHLCPPMQIAVPRLTKRSRARSKHPRQNPWSQMHNRKPQPPLPCNQQSLLCTTPHPLNPRRATSLGIHPQRRPPPTQLPAPSAPPGPPISAPPVHPLILPIPRTSPSFPFGSASSTGNLFPSVYDLYPMSLWSLTTTRSSALNYKLLLLSSAWLLWFCASGGYMFGVPADDLTFPSTYSCPHDEVSISSAPPGQSVQSQRCSSL